MIKYSVAQHIPSGGFYLLVADYTNGTTGYVEVWQAAVHSEGTGYHLPRYPENYGPVANAPEDAEWIAAQQWNVLVPEAD